MELQAKKQSFWSTFKKAYLKSRNLKNFWKKLDKKNLSNELIKTTDIFVNSESYNWTSKFWRHLMINHYKFMSDKKLSNNPSKEISQMDYSGFSFIDENSVEMSCDNIKEKIDFTVDLFKKHYGFSLTKSIHYNLVSLILYENIKSKKIFDHYDKVNKKIYQKYSPELEINNKLISQHMLISMLEFEKINTLVKNINKPLNILELGAGYGRTANMFLSLSEGVKYVVADFPPAITLSENNLKESFPNKKITSAFEINNKEDMEKTFKNNDVLFILPHQINLFERKNFSLSIAIGCLNEMEKKQIVNYMKIFENISNFLYIKAWEYSGLPYSFYKYYSVHRKTDFSIKEEWIEHFKDRCVIPSNQFELGYEFKN